MATVDVQSNHAVREPDGGVRGRVERFLVQRAGVIMTAAVPVTVLLMVLMILVGRAGLDEESAIDYQVYRWAMETWLSGGDLMNTAPEVTTGVLLPWVYPPFALVVLAPFALLPFQLGIIALFAVDLLAIGSSLYLVTRRMWPAIGSRGAAAVAMGVLPFTTLLEPVYSSFGLGQVNIALMGLVAVDCLAQRPRWPRGLLVGLAAAIKLTPAAFLLFFLMNRQMRAAVVAIVTAAIGTLLGFALNWKASLDYWFGSGPASGVSGSPFHTNQSIRGALARLGMPESVETGLWVVGCLICLAIVAFALSRVDPVLGVLGTALLALLVSPTSWSDHWVWCAPALLAMFGYAVRERSGGWWAVSVVTLILTLTATFNYVPNADPWTKVQHVIGNPYFLWGLVLIVLLGVCAVRTGRDTRKASELAGVGADEASSSTTSGRSTMSGPA